jgi:hypothetical protein
VTRPSRMDRWSSFSAASTENTSFARLILGRGTHRD